MDNSDPSIAFFPDHCIIPKTGVLNRCDYFVLNTQLVHRLSYLMYIGRVPNNMAVMHTCDNHACMNPKHLILGTFADVTKKRATYYFGEKIPHAKLTADIVCVIRDSEMSNAGLAAIYGVSKQSIYAARIGKSWKHVKPKPD